MTISISTKLETTYMWKGIPIAGMSEGMLYDALVYMIDKEVEALKAAGTDVTTVSQDKPLEL